MSQSQSQRGDIKLGKSVTTAELTGDLLEAMRQGKDIAPANPLFQFLSIHRFHTFLDPAGGIPAQIRIFRRLCRLIRQELNRHRAQYQLPLLSTDLQDSAITLTEDFATGNAELQAWSLLYHRYVRIELDLSLKQISGQVNEPERTLHRRQAHGFYRLASILNTAEAQARRKHRTLLLRNRLPRLPSSLLIGRDELLQWAIELLRSRDYRQLLVTGDPGIGKTAFVHRVAAHLIEDKQINELGWIDKRISSLEGLTEAVAEALELPLAEPAVVSNYLLSVKCLLIFDDAEDLVNNAALFGEASDLLGNAFILLTCRRLTQPYPNLPILLLPDLSREAVYELIDRQTSIVLYGSAAIDYEALYQQFGGNPGSLIAGFVRKSVATVSVASASAPATAATTAKSTRRAISQRTLQ